MAFIKEVRLFSGDFIEFPIVATNSKPLRLTICWADPAGNPPPDSLDPTNRMLVNDLDLRVISPDFTTNFPWVLNPLLPAAAPVADDNDRDNVEQVDIAIPTNGQYIVRITHKGTLVDDASQSNYQNVSILISGNIAQPPTLPVITSIAQVGSNALGLTWTSDVGRFYRVQYRDDLASGSWQYATGEFSGTKTNTGIIITADVSVTNRFYRVAQVR